MERAGLWVVTVALAAYLFVFVPAPSPEPSIYMPKVLFLGAVVILAALLYAERLRKTLTGWLPLLLAAHLALVTASDVLLHDPGGWTYPFFGAAGRADGWLFSLVVVGLALVVVVMIGTHGAPTVLRHVAGAILVAGVGQALVMFLQAGGVDLERFMYLQHKYLYPDGTTANSGFVAAVLLGALLAGCLLLLAEPSGRRWRLLRPAIAIVAIALGMTGNRTSLIALAVVLLPILTIRVAHLRRWFVVALALTVLTAAATDVVIPKAVGDASGALVGRVRIWRYAGDVIRVSPRQPLLGLGPSALRLAIVEGLLPPQRLVPLHDRDANWPKGATLLSVTPIRAPGTPVRSTLFQFRFKLASGGPFTYQLPSQYDKAHDLWLDEAASNGVIDGILWLVLFGGAIVLAWRRRDPTSRLLALSVLALAVFYVAWFPAVFFWPYHVALLVLAWRYRPLTSPARATQSTQPATSELGS